MMQDVEKHDTGHMLGKGMFDVVSSFLRIADDEEPTGTGRENAEGEQPSETIESMRQNRRGSIQALWDRHATTLNSLGLSIVLRHGGASTPAGPVEYAALILKDPVKFGQFLATLTPEDLPSTLRTDLSAIVSALETQLFSTDWSDPDADGLHLIANLADVSTHLERLGLKTESGRIAEHRRWLAAGAMREYASIRSQGLLLQPGKGFGPADWHRDTTEENYAKRWQSALDSLRGLSRKPKTAALTAELRSHLIRCAESADKALASVKSRDTSAFQRTLSDTLSSLKG